MKNLQLHEKRDLILQNFAEQSFCGATSGWLHLIRYTFKDIILFSHLHCQSIRKLKLKCWLLFKTDFSLINCYAEFRYSTPLNKPGQDRLLTNTAQKMKFFIKNLFSKCDQIRQKLRIWSHLLKKSLIENLFFCTVDIL